jgi:hypothetical protein
MDFFADYPCYQHLFRHIQFRRGYAGGALAYPAPDIQGLKRDRERSRHPRAQVSGIEGAPVVNLS